MLFAHSAPTDRVMEVGFMSIEADAALFRPYIPGAAEQTAARAVLPLVFQCSATVILTRLSSISDIALIHVIYDESHTECCNASHVSPRSRED